MIEGHFLLCRHLDYNKLSSQSRFMTICNSMVAAMKNVQIFMPVYNLGYNTSKNINITLINNNNNNNNMHIIN